MENDTFDHDEALHRRVEWIETSSFGSIYARCAGDPTHPLILYLHGNSSKSRGATSKMWNGLMTALHQEMVRGKAPKADLVDEDGNPLAPPAGISCMTVTRRLRDGYMTLT